MNKNVLKFVVSGFCALACAQAYAMQPRNHPKLDEYYGIRPGGTVGDIVASPRLSRSGLVEFKNDVAFSTEDNQPLEFSVYPDHGFCRERLIPIDLEAGLPKVVIFHPYHGRLHSCAHVDEMAFGVYDAMRFPILEDPFNARVRQVTIGYGGAYRSGGPLCLDLVIQTNPFSKTGTIAGKDFNLPKEVNPGQQIPDTYTKMLFRPQNAMSGTGERNAMVNCYVRLLSGEGQPGAAPLLGGSVQRITRHEGGNASPNNLDVSGIVHSGESCIVGSCVYFHPKSAGAEPRTCIYTISVLLCSADATKYYQKFFEGSGGHKTRTFRDVWEFVFGLDAFRGKAPEAERFILKEVAGMSQVMPQ